MPGTTTIAASSSGAARRGRRRHRLAHRRPRLLRADRGPHPRPRRPRGAGLRRGGGPARRGTPSALPRPQRVHELGFETALSVGRHTNDKELSYYARTPSGFEWEVGWNPLVIDENTWEPGTHQGISIWGHKPVGQTIVDKFDEFRLGARSLARPERTVPALSGAGIPDD
ncbi:hypothetical protein GCM10022233_55430 [Streptomyces shaanxiensis]|uniref:Uncharacterized protein n=1 Tax=Streptomyces shaanxiensis TaxID=653357 RepID=A0ABP7VQ26_9ACTN